MLQRRTTFHNVTAAFALLAVVAVPLVWSLWGAVLAALDASAWRALAQEPQAWRALAMGLWTGLASTALAVAGTAWVLAASFGTRQWQRLARVLAPLLAVPHAAFAIGLVALVAPSGWLLRAVSPWATGLTEPPPWVTAQDPWGLGLIAALTLKEIPFLLWAALAHLQRADVHGRLQHELQLCHTMGYSAAQAWWRVGWPQLLPHLRGPWLAVLAYSLTVVDVALVIGPTSPPTLAVLAWQWLQDADAPTNALGAVAAWGLAAMVLLAALLAWATSRASLLRGRWTRGIAAHTAHPLPIALPRLLALLLAVYTAVMLALLLGSVAGTWPFPGLWPTGFTTAAWQSVMTSTTTVGTTVGLALTSSLTALLWTMAWLELAPAQWRNRAQPLLVLPLLLPALLWVVGLHRVAMAWQIDTTVYGLWLAHTLACLPYVLLALHGPYTGFDPRLQRVAASLGRSRSAFLLQVKWPLLRATLASGFAVGFAVSVAQYLTTLYVGAGRFNTVTTEAVTLAAGGQRSLSAAYAWLQWLLPVLVFACAAWFGRARRFGNLSTP